MIDNCQQCFERNQAIITRDGRKTQSGKVIDNNGIYISVYYDSDNSGSARYDYNLGDNFGYAIINQQTKEILFQCTKDDVANLHEVFYYDNKLFINADFNQNLLKEDHVIGGGKRFISGAFYIDLIDGRPVYIHEEELGLKLFWEDIYYIDNVPYYISVDGLSIRMSDIAHSYTKLDVAKWFELLVEGLENDLEKQVFPDAGIFTVSPNTQYLTDGKYLLSKSYMDNAILEVQWK